MKSYCVYILTNRSGTLYIGVTNDLERRVFEHKRKLVSGFTSQYNIDRLVWFDEFTDVNQAIEGEKKLKGWSRQKKLNLVQSMNPKWLDLAATWFRCGKGDSFEDEVDIDEVNRVLQELGARRK